MRAIGTFVVLTWHLPLWFASGAETNGQSFPLYALQVTAYSVVLAWLYRRSGGSLLLTMFTHAAFNNMKDIVPSADPRGGSPERDEAVVGPRGHVRTALPSA